MLFMILFVPALIVIGLSVYLYGFIAPLIILGLLMLVSLILRLAAPLRLLYVLGFLLRTPPNMILGLGGLDTLYSLMELMLVRVLAEKYYTCAFHHAYRHESNNNITQCNKIGLYNTVKRRTHTHDH